MPPFLLAALVTIRIYNYAGTPAGQVETARAAAEAIFRDAGVAVHWTDCRVPQGTSGGACASPLAVHELVLRLIASRDAAPDPGGRRTAGAAVRDLALGSSILDTDTRGGVLITVDPRLVAEVAASAGLDAGILLGRAMAHEVGHLLLGTSKHPRSGLMRALWSHHELEANRADDWRFLPAEAGALQQGLASRAAN